MSFFISSRNLLGSILSSQTDLPTLKNVDFMMAGARFSPIRLALGVLTYFVQRAGELSGVTTRALGGPSAGPRRALGACVFLFLLFLYCWGCPALAPGPPAGPRGPWRALGAPGGPSGFALLCSAVLCFALIFFDN